MKQLYPDLWQTKVEHPFAGLNTHAYFLKTRKGNVLFYNTGNEQDMQHMADLGGLTYQYLSHRDEVSESLKRIKERFGSKLCCHAKEEPLVTPSVAVDVVFGERTVHFAGIEVITTPGHTGGSISFLYRSPHGKTYLFTGDTLFLSKGQWETLVFPNAGGSVKGLMSSLLVYRELKPDIVLPNGSTGTTPFVEITQEQWKEGLDTTIRELKK